MRSLVISTLCIVIIIAGWTIFTKHSDSIISEMIYIIDTQIETSVTEKNWKNADKSLAELSAFWYRHKSEYLLFYDNVVLFDIDITLAKTIAYMYARSDDQALGEIAALREQLLFLQKNESIVWGNII